MATMRVTPDTNGYRVVHPLDDVAEQKCSSDGLGRIRMTRAVRVSLGVLRAYLIVMTLMLGYHVLDLAGVLHNPLKRAHAQRRTDGRSSENRASA
jgi:hypothetical protein